MVRLIELLFYDDLEEFRRILRLMSFIYLYYTIK